MCFLKSAFLAKFEGFTDLKGLLRQSYFCKKMTLSQKYLQKLS